MMQIKRVLLLSVILTLSLNITYAANHYVYKNANGSNNGTSWANAWKELNQINWASVQSGIQYLFLAAQILLYIMNQF
jgi:hypothetical protein